MADRREPQPALAVAYDRHGRLIAATRHPLAVAAVSFARDGDRLRDLANAAADYHTLCRDDAQARIAAAVRGSCDRCGRPADFYRSQGRGPAQVCRRCVGVEE